MSVAAQRPDASTELTEAQRALRAEAGQWSRQVARPRAKDLEWEADPRDRVPWDLVEEMSKKGWRTLTVPVSFGGLDADPLTLCVLIEEIAAGDMGLAVILDQTLKVARIFSWLANNEQQEAFFNEFLADPRYVLAICLTEPGAGSDHILQPPGFRFSTVARREGDGWKLSGRKRFISNGADAGSYIVFASTDPDRPASEGTTAFWVRADAPGFEVVRIHEKISQRTINNAELRFNDIPLGDDAVLGEVNRGLVSTREILRESAIEAGATVLGTGQGAYELAVAHASERIQGARRLIEHPNIATRLAVMATELEAARSLIWRAARAVTNSSYDLRLGSMAKSFAADAAVHAGIEAMEIHGGLGIMIQEGGVDKYLRDALSFQHSDGAQDAHRLQIARLTDLYTSQRA
jgi:alkylation response protein AidB-like acyl-CoA dehydrogenase